MSLGAVDAPRALFNGKDLSGWYTWVRDRGRNADPKGVFTVTNGVIHVTGEEFGSLVSEEEFSDYHLSLEYRFLGGKQFAGKKGAAPDSGLLFHSTGPDGAFWGTWMESVEANIILGMYADSLDSVDRVVVRVSSGTLARLAQSAGLHSSISPKHITADLILQYVRGMSNSQDIGAEMLHPLCDDKAAALEFTVDGVVDRLTGVPLKELKLRKDLLIACIIRNGREIIIPDGSSQISRGDHVLIVTTAQDIREIQNILP